MGITASPHNTLVDQMSVDQITVGYETQNLKMHLCTFRQLTKLSDLSTK
jgi:hypothetical protein